MNSLFKSIRQHLESLSFSIILFSILGTVSVLGTLIPQNEDIQFYRDTYGPAQAELFHGIGITDLYHTFWFNLLLGILCLSTLMCVIRRWKIVFRDIHNPVLVEPELWNERCFEQEGISFGDKESLPIIKDIYRGSGINTYQQIKDESGTIMFFGQKNPINRYGNLLSHCAVIIILLGGLIGKTIWPWSLDTLLSVPETSTVAIAKTPYYLRLDKFEEDYYPGGREVSEYRSYVTIIGADGKEFKGIIRVNHPLYYQGLSIYQNSRDKEGLRWVSTLEVIKDPGISLVYLGFGLLMAGLILGLGLEYRKLWIKIESGTGKPLRIRFACYSSRSQDQLSSRIAAILEKKRER